MFFKLLFVASATVVTTGLQLCTGPRFRRDLLRLCATTEPTRSTHCAVDRHPTTRRGALVAVPLIGLSLNNPALALEEEPEEPRNCNDAIYTILRVQEATLQEERLVRSGKFKDLQRANVKFAITLMLKNYRFADAFTTATTLASSTLDAAQVGRDAVDALQQILEYFDASSRSLKVDTISGEKLDFVLRALTAANTRIDAFLTYMPPAEVEKAKAVVKAENDKNLAEYKKAFPDEPVYLNPPPSN